MKRVLVSLVVGVVFCVVGVNDTFAAIAFDATGGLMPGELRTSITFHNIMGSVSNGILWVFINAQNGKDDISGVTFNGQSLTKAYHYLNYYFFEECTLPVVPNFVNNITVPVGEKNIALIKGKLNDFGLQYEAYFLNNNKAFSDATITYGIRWNIGMLDLDQLQTGDRVIILLHPIHWHKASVHAKIESFSIPGQNSCAIDTLNSTISVEMPHGTNKSSLVASYTLSPGAYAKVSGRMQFSRISINDFNNPVIYRIFAENRDVQKVLTIVVYNAKIQANLVSYSVPEMTGRQ